MFRTARHCQKQVDSGTFGRVVSLMGVLLVDLGLHLQAACFLLFAAHHKNVASITRTIARGPGKL